MEEEVEKKERKFPLSSSERCLDLRAKQKKKKKVVAVSLSFRLPFFGTLAFCSSSSCACSCLGRLSLALPCKKKKEARRPSSAQREKRASAIAVFFFFFPSSSTTTTTTPGRRSFSPPCLPRWSLTCSFTFVYVDATQIQLHRGSVVNETRGGRTRKTPR